MVTFYVLRVFPAPLPAYAWLFLALLPLVPPRFQFRTLRSSLSPFVLISKNLYPLLPFFTPALLMPPKYYIHLPCVYRNYVLSTVPHFVSTPPSSRNFSFPLPPSFLLVFASQIGPCCLHRPSLIRTQGLICHSPFK